MTRDEILEILRRHRPGIRAFGVGSLALFGSCVRGEERPGSDVDVLVEFEAPVGLFKFVSLQRYLEGLVGRSVDLATPEALRPEMREAVLAEAVHAG